MRRLVGWIGGALGGVTAYRLLRRRPEVAAEATDDRAEELRAKLAETRVAEPEVVEEELPEEPVADEAPVEAEPESPEDRRRRIHEEGRAALDEMSREPDADS